MAATPKPVRKIHKKLQQKNKVYRTKSAASQNMSESTLRKVASKEERKKLFKEGKRGAASMLHHISTTSGMKHRKHSKEDLHKAHAHMKAHGG